MNRKVQKFVIYLMILIMLSSIIIIGLAALAR